MAGITIEHNAATTGDIHGIANWSVSSITARDALTVTAADLFKVCQVGAGETSQLYYLANSNPIVWRGLGGAGAPVQSVFGRLGTVVAQAGDYSDEQVSSEWQGTVKADIDRIRVLINEGTFGAFVIENAAEELVLTPDHNGAVIFCEGVELAADQVIIVPDPAETLLKDGFEVVIVNLNEDFNVVVETVPAEGGDPANVFIPASPSTVGYGTAISLVQRITGSWWSSNPIDPELLEDAATAIQPGDGVSMLDNDEGYQTAQDIADLNLGTASQSDVGDFATAAQGATADSALQPGDNISQLTNNAGYIPDSQKGAVNGVAPLNGSAKIDTTYLPDSVLGGLNYQGAWDAGTNTPTLTSGSGTKGHYYKVSVAGTTNLDGEADWNVGDWAVFGETGWQKVDNTESPDLVREGDGNSRLVNDEGFQTPAEVDARIASQSPVQTVHGRTGNVTGQSGDYSEQLITPAGVLSVTGAGFFIENTHLKKDLWVTSTSDVTFTFGANATYPFPVGGIVNFFKDTANVVAFAAGTGVTLKSAGGLEILSQGSWVTAKYLGSDTWSIVGDL